jgi:hypothetical protein
MEMIVRLEPVQIKTRGHASAGCIYSRPDALMRSGIQLPSTSRDLATEDVVHDQRRVPASRSENSIVVVGLNGFG